jgi:hypothetical protein
VTRPDDRDDSADENIPPLTVQLDVIRPAVLLLQASGVLIPATADTLLDHLDREIGNGARAIVLDLSWLAVLGVDALPALSRSRSGRERSTSACTWSQATPS